MLPLFIAQKFIAPLVLLAFVLGLPSILVFVLLRLLILLYVLVSISESPDMLLLLPVEKLPAVEIQDLAPL